jgi:hypothetical protein
MVLIDERTYLGCVLSCCPVGVIEGEQFISLHRVPFPTRDQIRMHLTHVAHMFSSGYFNAPMFIHGTKPPGVASYERAARPNSICISGDKLRCQSQNSND